MKSKTMIPVLGMIAVILAGSACTPKMTIQESSYNTPAGASGMSTDVRDPLFLNEVNAKVLRSFNRTYGELPAAKWYRAGTGFRVVFVNNEMNHAIYYKQNGLVDAKILSYSEDRLPPQVRHFVRSRFYDYAISHVTEVHKNGATAFYVKLEDDTIIRTVKIVDEVWEEVESIIKR